MYYTIYKITNQINGKFYIGKHVAKNLDDGYMGSGKLIIRAIKKYGVENFKKEILHVFETEAEMNEAEARLVILNENSYNLCPGGKGGFGYINKNGLSVLNKLSPESEMKRRASLSIYNKKAIASGDPKWQLLQQRSAPARNAKYPLGTFKDKKHSNETRQKMSEKAKERTPEKNSQYGTIWITNGLTNKKLKKIDTIPEGWYKGRTT